MSGENTGSIGKGPRLPGIDNPALYKIKLMGSTPGPKYLPRNLTVSELANKRQFQKEPIYGDGSFKRPLFNSRDINPGPHYNVSTAFIQ